MSTSNIPKVVLVTGASSGIGREVALQFGRKGARVALVARRRDRLDEVAEQVRFLGGEPLVLPTDISVREQMEAAVHAVEECWGRMDVLVNNAGYGVYGTVEECEPEDFERQIAVNYLGAVYATKAALPLMRRQRSGTIINVSSISGSTTSPFDSSYCASKSALNAFTSVLRMELAGSGISVSLICPGYTKAEFETALIQRRPYTVRTFINPVTSERVAREIVICAQRPRSRVIIPKFLLVSILVEALLPSLHEWRQIKFRRPGVSSTHKEINMLL
ncbi:SDR family NAD(P)-dependent oxidoreductase [Chloroflexota bacterium]